MRTPATRSIAPVAAAAAALAGVAVLRVRDPHVSGSYGFCPFHELTGWWCPACGGLRATNALAQGDVLASLSSNVFVVPLILGAVLAWVMWVSGRPVRYRPGRIALIVTVAVLLVFTVVRNTSWGSWLAPG
ncbi:DUF2752 domain-containing protein [Aldersonia kunmingensis]|uniref:DUF2752 domain-containing protein n=1 Tax=Aldersonia kunmingensis TaxID=408066 RepID=UPI001FE11D77|nr:DUF2752 domain-containing protein [Aldersonia kunmingensis]